MAGQKRLASQFWFTGLEGSVGNRHALNATAVFLGENNIHVTGLSEHGVNPIEVGLSFMNDEKLASCTIHQIGSCHWNNSSIVS